MPSPEASRPRGEWSPEEKIAAYEASIRRAEELRDAMQTQLTEEERELFQHYLDQNESGVALMCLANVIDRSGNLEDARMLLSAADGDDPAARQIQLTLRRMIERHRSNL